MDNTGNKLTQEILKKLGFKKEVIKDRTEKQFMTKITLTKKKPSVDDIEQLKKYTLELIAENDTNIDKSLSMQKKKWIKNVLVREIRNVTLFINQFNKSCKGKKK